VTDEICWGRRDVVVHLYLALVAVSSAAYYRPMPMYSKLELRLWRKRVDRLQCLVDTT
jgi:hypothetical protein